MRDYFKELLINKNPMSSFLGDPQVAAEATSALSSIKTHAIWAVVTIAVAYLSWKASKWYAGYEFMKQAAITPPTKSA